MRSSTTRSDSSLPKTEVAPEALLLIGTTAVGKTAVLRQLATRLPTVQFEIISADSRQVYRGMDIGTAKPTAAERERTPHHLIDILDPRDDWDVGRFVEAADRLVADIRRRGAVPVISGGTAFYVRGYLFGLPKTPKAGPELRRRLEERRDREGLEALRRELASVDPESAAKIAPRDAYRIMRALEVYHATGRPRSAFRYPDAPRESVAPVVVGLRREREVLARRIDRRVAAMFDAGLPDEVAGLAAQGLTLADPGMRSIGYREFLEHGPPPWSESDLSTIRDLIVRNTRGYAKRQETFFRRLPNVRWADADDSAGVTKLLEDAVKRISP